MKPSHFFKLKGPLAATLLLLPAGAMAHPMPDIPVRSFFEADGSVVIQVEIDPRSFTEDPMNEPYVQNWVYGEMDEEEKSKLIKDAEAYITKAVEIRFPPIGKMKPEFKWRFTGHGDKKLEKIDDPVMLTGEWKTTIPGKMTGYQVHALNYRQLSVLFLNHVRDQAIERFQVLFPGETSYVLDLEDLAGETAAKKTAPKKDKTAQSGKPASS